MHIEFAADRAGFERIGKQDWRVRRDVYASRSVERPPVISFSTPRRRLPRSEAMKQLRDELAARRSGSGVLLDVWDGAYRYLFMSDAPVKIRTTGKLAETHDATATPRPDLTLTEPSHCLQY